MSADYARPEETVTGGMTRIERIADVIVEHSFDHEIGECMCGWAGDRRALAEHVAGRVEAIL